MASARESGFISWHFVMLLCCVILCNAVAGFMHSPKNDGMEAI
jgi:hypothetical protein